MNRSQFSYLVFLLLNHANRLGLSYAIDYVKRSPEEQERLFAEGKSKTLKSRHLEGKAIDLIIFVGGKPQWEHPGYKLLGEFWKSLDKECVWGGDWKSLNDYYHFEIKGE